MTNIQAIFCGVGIGSTINYAIWFTYSLIKMLRTK